ncbi:MAG: Gfo/Idh/MocA family oxidoreductase [Cyclobacteriaceae bacterium]
MSKQILQLNRRAFLKGTAALGALSLLPEAALSKLAQGDSLRTAHVGVGAMGVEDLKAFAAHDNVIVSALCDVDAKNLEKAGKMFPEAKLFKDYRSMLDEIGAQIDAVVVSTPDHTHAPASLKAMNMGKPVYCQKPLTHHVTEAREMAKVAKEKNLVTQMGIQVHSFYDYKLATILIQSGIIGKVHTVHAWSPKNWGYDGKEPEGSDPIPESLDWNLWLGTSAERPFKKDLYHPGNWRKLMDYGCGTLGDMGVHIFDTPYNALALDVPQTIVNNCRKPTGFGYPEKNKVTYEFPGTAYTGEKLTWIWYDGEGAPADHQDLGLPNGDQLPDQGAMFMGEKGKLLLPHFMQLPKHIIDGKYVDIDISKYDPDKSLGSPVSDYGAESNKHYHQFVDACLGKSECSAPFSYASRLTETILLGVIAGRFPGKTLHWDREKAEFAEKEANKYLSGVYRDF